MKKMMSVPFLLAVVLFAAACGKSDDTAPSIVAAPAAVSPTPTPGITLPTGQDIASWCYQRGGQFNPTNSICRIEEVTKYDWSKYYGSINTGRYVNVNDLVTVRADGTYQVSVSGIQYSGTFIAQSAGAIIVKGDGYKSFKIRSISITRCYDSSGYVVACQ